MRTFLDEVVRSRRICGCGNKHLEYSEVLGWFHKVAVLGSLTRSEAFRVLQRFRQIPNQKVETGKET